MGYLYKQLTEADKSTTDVRERTGVEKEGRR
jgi:hypothetical protein